MPKPRTRQCFLFCIEICLPLLLVLAIARLPLIFSNKNVGFSKFSSQFDKTVGDTLKRESPDYIFIGDSMLYTRIAEEYLEKLLGGAKVAFIANGGSSSAQWYLQFKNYVVAGGLKPKRVFLFFRDHYLTEPLHRTSGPYIDAINRQLTLHEPVFESIVYGFHGDYKNRALEIVDNVFSSHTYRQKFEGLVHGFAKILPGSVDSQSFDLENVNQYFASAPMRKASVADTGQAKTDEYLDFHSNLKNSFLPHMVGLARDSEIQLVFFRVQRRPTEQGPPEQSAALIQYVRDLRTYLEANGCTLLDDTGDPVLTIDMYGDGDHIAPKHMEKYTEHFFNKFRNEFL